MERAQHRCSPVGQTLDQGDLPERTGPVEALHLRQPGHLQDSFEGAGFGRRNRTHVEVQVELGTLPPPWRCGQRRSHHPLAEHRQLVAEPLEPVSDLVPVRGSVQHHQGDHGRSQAGIAFHRPGEGVAALHEISHSVLPLTTVGRRAGRVIRPDGIEDLVPSR